MAAKPIRVGASIRPQHGTYATMRQRWRDVEVLGADTLWTWDHFFPLSGEPDGLHYECWSLLAAMGEATERIPFGALVTCNSFRNPNLLADMARTVDHISGGRLILGIGSGWVERDYAEYGYDFKTAPDRLRDLAAALPVMTDRLSKLDPGPVNGHIPLMIGGSGEKVTLRLVAQYADIWNGVWTGRSDPAEARRLGRVLDDWCAKVGRDPDAIERSMMLRTPEQVALADDYVDAGMTHLIVGASGPDWNLDQLQQLIDWRDRRQPAS
ncbi:MAG TPA: LLM class F420-dependent oxidoreductase [Thermomicrobiales bacterium]|nr:LLM class F420-dependent oxidoreductase [Thermomicrobiales bacterium]